MIQTNADHIYFFNHARDCWGVQHMDGVLISLSAALINTVTYSSMEKEGFSWLTGYSPPSREAGS